MMLQTGIFSSTVAYENMRSWLTLFFNLNTFECAIAVWPFLLTMFQWCDAANRCFSSTVAYENMQSWLSLFFHLFILIWPALEVGPRHMIINTFNQLRHLAYGVTQPITYRLSFFVILSQLRHFGICNDDLFFHAYNPTSCPALHC